MPTSKPNPAAPSATSIFQHPGATGQTLAAIERHLSSSELNVFRVAVAYARWEGIGLFSTKLEAFLSRGGRFDLIVGIENGVTTPDILLYALVLQKRFPKLVTARTITDEFANSIMHTKFYEFQCANETTALVGSANLTGGGLVRNTELSMEYTVAKGSNVAKEWAANWIELRKVSKPVSLKTAQKLSSSKRSGNEKDRAPESQASKGKPFLASKQKPSPKPLFSNILGLKNKTQKNQILADLDSLTERPEILYLQILKYETGGSSGRTGYQVQLPVATLGTYFGVGKKQSRAVTFHFPKDEINVSLTHFENHTHRVRLKPITLIPRPAILKFERIANDEYKVSVVPKNRYASVLKKKCDQQSRAGARKWGFE